MTSNKQNRIQYYDVLQSYTGANSQMRYYQQLSQALVDNASNYYLSVDRFNIPMSNVPIFIFNPSTNYYTVELVYNNIGSGPVSLVYDPPELLPQTSAYYYYVYSYNKMIGMLNTALSTAFTILDGLVTLPAGSIAPWFEIDPITHIMCLVAQVNFYAKTLTTPIKIFTNTNLQKFTVGIPLSNNPAVTNGRNVLFTIADYKNNTRVSSPSAFYVMSSEYGSQTLINWNVAVGFVFVSDTIPVNPEYLPIVKGQNLLNAQKIVANFDFINTSDMTKGLVAQYVLQSPYKKMNLIGNNAIHSVDITVYWYDNLNNFYPIYLRQDETMSIRLLFIPLLNM